MTIEELKEFHDNTLAKEKWEVPTVRLFTQDEVIATLEGLNLEIDEMFTRRIDYTVDKIQDLIQQKINALKEASDA